MKLAPRGLERGGAAVAVAEEVGGEAGDSNDTATTMMRDITIPLGVLDEGENPYLRASIDDDEDYGGVRLQMGYPEYLLVANQAAIDETARLTPHPSSRKRRGQGQLVATPGEVRYNVLATAASRLIRKYGPERARIILSGHGNSEEQEYLVRLVACERIRLAVTRAIQDALHHEQAGELISSLREMQTNVKVRDDVLQNVQTWEDRAPALQVRSAGVRTVAEQLLEWSLPRKRQEEAGAQRYLLAEMALVKALVLDTGGTYVTHAGTQKTYGDVTGPEWLRRAAMVLLRDAGETNVKDDRWQVTPALNTAAFNKGKRDPEAAEGTFNDAPGACRSVGDAYYLHKSWLEGDDNICRLPFLPVMGDWNYENLRSHSTGGIRGGQIGDLMQRHIIPLVARWVIKNGPNSPELTTRFPPDAVHRGVIDDAARRHIHSRRIVRRLAGDHAAESMRMPRGSIPRGVSKFDSLMDWARTVWQSPTAAPVVGRGLTVEDLFAVMEIMCEDIGNRALALIDDKSFLET